MSPVHIVIDTLFGLLALLAWRTWQVSHQPAHFVIGKPGSAYMNRWYVIPRNRLFNIYLHQILRSDDDRALHDHPWLNLSIVLRGGYREVMPYGSANDPALFTIKWRGRGSMVLRRPTASHRLEVDDGRPCWSLFITGPKVREWGFWCPQGWKVWTSFVDVNNTGAVGPGCGEGST